MPAEIVRLNVESPVGILALELRGETIIRLTFEKPAAHPLPSSHEDAPFAQRVRYALDSYFAGDSTALDRLAVAPEGTTFRQRVWAALRDIPAGMTATYGEIARAVGSPAASRAVGGACGANPIAIIIPCHRVVAHGGRIGGFSGELWRKRVLLGLEGAPGFEEPRLPLPLQYAPDPEPHAAYGR